jgi:hypothetical protein
VQRTAGPRGFPTEISQSEDGALLRVPLGSREDLVGWLSVEYTRADPLIVSVGVRAPSLAAVLERSILRMDLRNTQTGQVRYSDVAVAPSSMRGYTSFQFEETHVIVTAMVPTDIIARFLRATDDVVAPGKQETAAVSAVFADLLQDRNA